MQSTEAWDFDCRPFSVVRPTILGVCPSIHYSGETNLRLYWEGTQRWGRTTLVSSTIPPSSVERNVERKRLKISVFTNSTSVMSMSWGRSFMFAMPKTPNFISACFTSFSIANCAQPPHSSSISGLAMKAHKSEAGRGSCPKSVIGHCHRFTKGHGTFSAGAPHV